MAGRKPERMVPAGGLLQGSPLETLGLCCAGGVLALSLLHLGAAHMAARVAGRPPLRAGLPDAGVALVRLWSHASNPKEAWPLEAAAGLPGPVPYWACVALLLLAVTVVAIVGVRLVRSLGRGQRLLGVEPHAGLGTGRDMRALRVKRPTPGRLTLGRVDGHLIATEPQVSLAVIGPTGCGKTVGLAIPGRL